MICRRWTPVKSMIVTERAAKTQRCRRFSCQLALKGMLVDLVGFSGRIMYAIGVVLEEVRIAVRDFES